MMIKHAKFGAISDFKLRSRISPERVKVSKIGKRTDRELSLVGNDMCVIQLRMLSL